MKKVLAFDFDGTIVDSMNELAVFAAELINEQYGLSREMSQKLFLFTSGIPFNEQLELMFPGKEQNQMIYETFERLKEEHALEYPLYPEVKEVFSKLSQVGYKLALSSSNAQHILENYVEHYELNIDLVCGYRGPDFGKGEAHFNHISDYFEVGFEDIIFVGDSLQDYERAQSCSVNFIARASTFSVEELKQKGVSTVIHNLTELLAVLGHGGKMAEVK